MSDINYQYTVTIGRNVGGEEMEQRRWAQFIGAVKLIIENAVTNAGYKVLMSDTFYSINTSYRHKDGTVVAEESALIKVLWAPDIYTGPLDWDKLKSGLASCGANYGQESIAASFGTSSLLYTGS